MDELYKPFPEIHNFREKFLDDFSKVATESLGESEPERMQALGRNMISHIVGEPEEPIEVKFSPQKKLIVKVLRIFGDAIKIQETLDYDISILKSRMPNVRKLPKSEFMRRAIASHLATIYIFRERIRRFCNETQELPSTRVAEAKKETKKVLKVYDIAYERELKWRNLHTHQFEYDDEMLSRISSQELFLRHGILGKSPKVSQELKRIHDGDIRKYRQLWRNRFIRNRKSADLILDLAYFVMRPHIYSNNE